ncbi:hypothetical protein [Alloactinosynnema sp. L-07]|nr:hypothetical protein [Alloactinosynnema sp. L-07]
MTLSPVAAEVIRSGNDPLWPAADQLTFHRTVAATGKVKSGWSADEVV